MTKEEKLYRCVRSLSEQRTRTECSLFEDSEASSDEDFAEAYDLLIMVARDCLDEVQS